MNFQQVPKDYIFKVGDVIRMGGRVGRIEDLWKQREAQIKWNEGNENCLSIDLFPSLEIAIPSPTLSKEAYEELERWAWDMVTFTKADGWTVSDQNGVIRFDDLKKKMRSMLPGGED